MKYSIFDTDDMSTLNGVRPKQWYNFSEAAKIINLPKIGRNKLLEIFRKLKIIGNDDWYKDLLDMPDHFLMNPTNGVNMPLISIKGIEFLQEKFPNELN